jgi:hypothetical protein
MAYDVSKRPGEWVSAQAQRRERRVWLVVGLAMTLVVLVAWVSLGVRNVPISLVLLAAMFGLYRIGERQCDAALSWIRGAHSEAAVGEALTELVQHGYTVMHDIEQDGEGNIDHLVSGPTGVYLVETKHRRYEVDQLRKAKRQAAKLAGQLGVWVTPVICLDRRASRKPYRHAGVWIVSRERLCDWVQAQRNPALDFDRLADFADRL